jgi:2-polyprenyl-6-methoxyphenol hydroxylase-like FAD-dependent oxidoreductase
LVALEQDGSGIAAIVETPAGREVLRGDWLIGTDGARSTVRTLLELPFEGFTWPDRFVATNVRFDAEAAGYAPSNMVHHPVDWAVVSRLGREDAWRVTYGEDPELPESEIRARIPEHYARIMPPGTKYEVIAAAPYRVHERSAPAYRVGRVLLAGDAAHACNPCGGMGLTGGAFDAAMLIDALAAVAGGTGPESLLDQYSDERRRVFLEISSPTAQGHKQRITSMNKAEQRQAAAQFQAVAADPEVMRQGMMFSFQVRGRPLTLPA